MSSAEKLSLTGVIHPFSMEEKTVYFTRFFTHPKMMFLFLDPEARRIAARQTWEVAWENALVTVRKLDGSEFFIE